MRACVVLGMLAVLPSARVFAARTGADCPDADMFPASTATCTAVAADAGATVSAGPSAPAAHKHTVMLKTITVVGTLETIERATRHGRVVRVYRLATDHGCIVTLPAVKGPQAVASASAADLAACVGKRVKVSGSSMPGRHRHQTATRLLTISKIEPLATPDSPCPTRASTKKR